MVLRGDQRGDAFAIADEQEADLFAFEKLLEKNVLPASPSEPWSMAVAAWAASSLAGGDDDALARGEAIGLDDDGRAEVGERGLDLGLAWCTCT